MKRTGYLTQGGAAVRGWLVAAAFALLAALLAATVAAPEASQAAKTSKAYRKGNAEAPWDIVKIDLNNAKKKVVAVVTLRGNPAGREEGIFGSLSLNFGKPNKDGKADYFVRYFRLKDRSGVELVDAATFDMMKCKGLKGTFKGKRIKIVTPRSCVRGAAGKVRARAYSTTYIGQDTGKTDRTAWTKWVKKG